MSYSSRAAYAAASARRSGGTAPAQSGAQSAMAARSMIALLALILAAAPSASGQHAPLNSASQLLHVAPRERQQPLQVLQRLLSSLQDAQISQAAASQLLEHAVQLRDRQIEARRRRHAQAGTPGGAAAAAGSTSARCGKGDPSHGILITAAAGDQLMNAYISLALLYRHYNCSLPAEVVYYDPGALQDPAARAIEALARETGARIKLVDGSPVVQQQQQQQQQQLPAPAVTGFVAKVHALVHVTCLRHVLLLDSDNMPLADPSPLFSTPLYQRAGNLFWPDFWTNMWMRPACYLLLGLAVPWEADGGYRATESGQLLIDRAQHEDVLQWLWLLTAHKDVTWKCVWGDKDTFRMAFQLAGKAAAFQQLHLQPHLALSRMPGGYRHAGMLQLGPDLQLLFFHRTAAAKFWPHCARGDASVCTLAAFTMPVDQEQLLASVPDPTMMTLADGAVDERWQGAHCHAGARGPVLAQPQQQGTRLRRRWRRRRIIATRTGAAANGTAGREDDGVRGKTSTTGRLLKAATSAAALVPPVKPSAQPLQVTCDYPASQGLRPIPVVTKHMPAGLTAVLATGQKVFEESLKLQQQQTPQPNL